MFEIKKTLIVVYKDELLLNQLKKMVETDDDTEEGVVGTKDDTINIVSWTEDVWLSNKKQGTTKGKILFLGNVKGTENLIPVIDVMFDKYGVKFGWAGDQAIVYADPNALISRKDYDVFLERFSTMPVPNFLKATKENSVTTSAGSEAGSIDEQCEKGALANVNVSPVKVEDKKADVLKNIRSAFSMGLVAIEKVGAQISSKSEELFRNKALMKRQMLFYGVINLYNDGLEKFMNM